MPRHTESPIRRRRGRPNRPEEAKAAERDAILDAAERVARSDGPSASLEAITTAAGVRKPAVYEHFADKAALAEALGVAVQARVSVSSIEAIRQLPDPSTEQIVRLGIDAFTRFAAQETNIYRFITQSVRAGGRDVLDTSLTSSFRLAIDAYFINVDPPLPRAVRNLTISGVIGMVYSVTETWLANRPTSRKTLVDTLVALVAGSVDHLADHSPFPNRVPDMQRAESRADG
jgi:AcrR family transcriptional regulator